MRIWWCAMAQPRRRWPPSSPPNRFSRSSPMMLPLRAFTLLGLLVCDAWHLLILLL
jgi:hypothetical protein